MNMTGSVSSRRSLSIVAGTWILLVSALVIADHVRLSRSIHDRPAGVEPARVATLSNRIEALEITVTNLKRQPAPVHAAEYDSAEAAQNAQLSRIENSLTDFVHTADVTSLTQQVTRLHAEIWRLRHPLASRLRRVAAVVGVPPQPVEQPLPFQVLGTELRGGEEFLAVAPGDAHSLSQARVLRAGESDGDWKLEAIKGRTAVFENGGQLHRVPIP